MVGGRSKDQLPLSGCTCNAFSRLCKQAGEYTLVSLQAILLHHHKVNICILSLLSPETALTQAFMVVQSVHESSAM